MFDENGRRKGAKMFWFSPVQFPDERSVKEFVMLCSMTPMLVMFSMFQSGSRMTELIRGNVLLYRVPS